MVQKTKKKKLSVQILLARVLLVAVITIAYSSISNCEKGPLHRKAEIEETPPGSTAPISTDTLYSSHAILVCLDDRSILMEKNSEEKIYPASLTKMMTVMVAIENLKDLQEEITLNDSMFQKLYHANATTAGFQPGEKVRAISLLYGALLPSGAECCIGLADRIAGSEQAFVKMMNRKAADIGLYDTHFTNTTGLHEENHSTTVKDMAVLLCHALQNDTFREIFTATRYSTLPTNKHPDGITFYSTMFTRIKDISSNNGKILGGKTGYTNKAGLCLASLGKERGKEYLLVTAGAKGDYQSEQYNIIDAINVYNSLGKE
ncbi:MAG: D-alanyl-D-alanine carboxypeptidase [Firmicutes bacterium]|nr:D-alanyl-D-alanine carboxypeptidase [Bacillota bacterium]